MDKLQILTFLVIFILYFLYKAIVLFVKGIYNKMDLARYFSWANRKRIRQVGVALLMFGFFNLIVYLSTNPSHMLSYYAVACLTLSFFWLWMIDDFDLTIKDTFSLTAFGAGCILLKIHPLIIATYG